MNSGSTVSNKGIKNTLLLAQNEIKYHAQITQDLSPLPSIQATGGQINQVLLNIIMNAVQAINRETEYQKRNGSYPYHDPEAG